MKRSILLILLVLAACAGPRLPPPDPQIRTVRVELPVVQQCPALERLGPAPTYPDTQAALLAAPDIAVRVALLLAGRVLRIAREQAVNAALAACAAAPAAR